MCVVSHFFIPPPPSQQTDTILEIPSSIVERELSINFIILTIFKLKLLMDYMPIVYAFEHIA